MQNALKPEDQYLIQSLTVFGPINSVSNPFLKNVLGIIACFPTAYNGSLDPRAIAGVKLIAGRLGDTYNIDKNRLERLTCLDQNYFRLIAQQAENDFYLIAFDESWVLAAIRDYIELTKAFSPDQVKVYRFSKLHLVFAPVTAIQQEAILTWLYQNRKLFDARSAVCLFDYPAPDANDIQHLFPIGLSFLGTICIFESIVLSQEQLEAAITDLQMIYSIPGLDPIKATFAAHMAMENTNFDYPIEFSDDKLRIWSAGYLGSEDLKSEFLRCLDQIEKTGTQFSTYLTGHRMFYCQGTWYQVSSQGNPVQPPENATDLVRLLRTNREKALQIYQALGYSWSPSVESFDIPVGYQTLDDGQEITTVYYYKSTNGKRIDILAVNGPDNGLLPTIQALSNQGYFLSQVAKAILKRYPKFILSSPTVVQNLPVDPTALRSILHG